MVIDTHIHLWDHHHPHPSPWPWAPDPNPVGDMLPLMDLHDVGFAVQVTPKLMEYDNHYSIEAAARAEGRLAVLARFDVEATQCLHRLEALLHSSEAIVGVRLTFVPDNLPDAWLRTRGAHDFFKALEATAALLSIYAPTALPQVAELAARYDTVPIVIDHAGVAVHPGAPNPLGGVDDLQEMSTLRNIYVKISGLPEVSECPYPFPDVHEVALRMLDAYGSDHLMWGSDYPNVLKACSYVDSLAYLRHIPGLPEHELSKIYEDAARALMFPRTK